MRPLYQSNVYEYTTLGTVGSSIPLASASLVARPKMSQLMIEFHNFVHADSGYLAGSRGHEQLGEQYAWPIYPCI
jgi:hypothetical protein